MKILFSMTYYRPYVSGPIVYVENLGAELARRGHAVTILTSLHVSGSPPEEMQKGIRIVRLPVAAHVSKGVLVPRLPFVAWRLIRTHDALLIQAPQLEAPLLTLLGRRLGVRTILTYHCDVELPRGIVNSMAGAVLNTHTRAAARMASRIVAYTEDYALHSPVMSRFLEKVAVVPPPVELAVATPAEIDSFRSRNGLAGCTVIGICGRVSAEKGLEVLLQAVPVLLQHYPKLRIVHAGEARQVMGESAYATRIRERTLALTDTWISLGVLDRRQLAVFYGACDVTVLPSLNRTESFGLVQVESMLCGTPVVVSDLPGVRVPIRVTGMGLTVRPGDPDALAAALLEVLRDPQRFSVPRERIEAEYSVARTADAYEGLIAAL